VATVRRPGRRVETTVRYPGHRVIFQSGHLCDRPASWIPGGGDRPVSRTPGGGDRPVSRTPGGGDRPVSWTPGGTTMCSLVKKLANLVLKGL